MAFVVKDRVKETTTTTGTGTLTLGGAVTGYQAFSVIGNTNTTYYAISSISSEWEVGIGTYTSSGTTLSRDTILASSNGGSAVDFSAGEKEVYVVYPAGRAVIVNGTSIDVPNNAILSVASGGTGANTLTAESVVVGNGTSAVKFVAPGTSGNVLTSNGTAWVSQAAGGGGGDYVMTVFTSPGTWTKPAGLVAVKVTVVGAGGNGGSRTPNYSTGVASGGGGGGAAIEYLDAPAIPGPVSVTAGPGTNSFGPFCSATAGSNGTNVNINAANGAAGGSGSGGTFNITGAPGSPSINITDLSLPGGGGPSILGGGGRAVLPSPIQSVAGVAGTGYGGGGGGAFGRSPIGPFSGGAGANGIVIVEEFY